MSSSKLASNPPLQADGVSLVASLNLSDGRERPREDHSDLRPSFNRHSARPARRWIHGHIYPTILSFQDKFTLFLPELDKLAVRSSPQSIVDDAGKRSIVKRASSPPDEDSEFRLPKSISRLYLSGYALVARGPRVGDCALATHFHRSSTATPPLPKLISPHSRDHYPPLCSCRLTVQSSGPIQRLLTLTRSPDIFVDASGYGLGVIMRRRWLAWAFNHDNRVVDGIPRDPKGNADIAWAELIAVELGLRVAVAAGYRCASIPIFSDNRGVVIAMETRSWKGKDRLARVMRRINSFCKSYHLDPQVKWIPTRFNPADGPSRGVCGDLQDMIWPLPTLPRSLAPVLYQIVDVREISLLEPPHQAGSCLQIGPP